MLAAAKHARERGLDVGIVSNCFWATSVADAKVWLAPLAELGLADLSLSSYAYFVEDADEERLRNAVLAAQELGIPVSVLEVGAPADIGVPDACSGDVCEVMHKGRAAVALAPAKASRPPETLTTCPFEDFTDPGRAHVGPDGELQVCQGISAGNVFAGGDGPPAPERPGRPARRRPARPCWTPTTRTPAPSSARSSPAARGPSPRPSATRRSAHCTPTNVICATKSAPRCAAPAASPKWSRRASATPRTKPRGGRPCRLSVNTSGSAGSYASSATRPARSRIPKITYGALKERGATVYPMDPDGGDRRGRRRLRRLHRAARRPCEAAVLELPKEETAAWVAKAADAGVKQIWIHQMTDTPEALAEAEKRGLKVITGHCAVMYNKPGMSMHAPHRWIWKLVGKY